MAALKMFRIERLEERIAPSHAGVVNGSQTQIGSGIGNGNGPHSTDVTFVQSGPASGSQLQSVSGIGNGNGPHSTDVTLIQIATPVGHGGGCHGPVMKDGSC